MDLTFSIIFSFPISHQGFPWFSLFIRLQIRRLQYRPSQRIDSNRDCLDLPLTTNYQDLSEWRRSPFPFVASQHRLPDLLSRISKQLQNVREPTTPFHAITRMGYHIRFGQHNLVWNRLPAQERQDLYISVLESMLCVHEYEHTAQLLSPLKIFLDLLAPGPPATFAIPRHIDYNKPTTANEAVFDRRRLILRPFGHVPARWGRSLHGLRAVDLVQVHSLRQAGLLAHTGQLTVGSIEKEVQQTAFSNIAATDERDLGRR